MSSSRCVRRVVVVLLVILVSKVLNAADREFQNELGFNVLESDRFTLVTDLPLDDELRGWPKLLDQAFEQWQTLFRAPESREQGLSVTAHVIGDRATWQSKGLLDHIPDFQDGYQFGDAIYLVEQPTVYYRRMLFFHELTHWIMYRWQGGAGPPWMMEGMADYFGTHQWDPSTGASLGFFPESPSQVDGWGRIRLVHESLRSKNAPALSKILQYEATNELRMNRYAWSWASCTFFLKHPELADDFTQLLRGRLDYSLTLSKQMARALDKDWDAISIQWRCFVDDLDFGVDPANDILRWTGKLETLNKTGERTVAVNCSRGWQSTGIVVSPKQSIEIEATGEYIVADGQGVSNSPWASSAAGVTARYYRGKPMGCLIGVLAELSGEQPTARWETTRIGTGTSMQAEKRSVLLLRVNEANRDLRDNRGELAVRVQVK
jgi:hypothetical protein